MSYRLSRKAEEDLIGLFAEGIQMFGLAQAERYHAALEHQFQSIAENPYVGRQRHELDPPVRVFPVLSHITMYTVDEDEEVFVVRIRHRREDWEAEGDAR